MVFATLGAGPGSASPKTSLSFTIAISLVVLASLRVSESGRLESALFVA